MKRLFSFFLAGILVCSLSGCKGNPEVRPSGETEAGQAVSDEADGSANRPSASQKSGGSLSLSPLRRVSYPKKTSFDDYEARRARRAANPVDKSYLQAVNSFAGALSVQVLRGQVGNRNLSPLSAYMALSLAASGACGETREELFTVLGLGGKETGYLAEQTNHLFQRLSFHNEIGRLHLANSIWLSENAAFHSAFVEQAAEKFCAPAYRVDFSGPQAAKAMGAWISEQTSSVLNPEVQVRQNEMLSLLNTVYFTDEWATLFDRQATKPDAFHVSAQQAVQCDFMHLTDAAHAYSHGEGFTRASLSLKNNGKMVFILPDATVSVDSLLTTPQGTAALFLGEDDNVGKVVFQIPKLSFGSALDLTVPLQQMGVRRAFQPGEADFSGITQSPTFFSAVRQETHVAIDEKGVEAAAFTQLSMATSARPSDQVVSMVLNRPFLYGIISDGVLIFTGICKNPAVRSEP